jgi:hypothetical protein
MSEERISREEIEDLAPKIAEAITEVMTKMADEAAAPEENLAAPYGDDDEEKV